MSDPVSNVTHHPCVLALRIETQHGLGFEEEGGGSEGLEEDFGDFRSIGVRIQGCFCDQHVMLLWVLDLHFCVDLFPNMLHVLSVLYNAVTHGVLEFEQPFVLFNVIANVEILVMASHHDFGMLGTTDQSVHFELRLFVSSKPYFDDTASVIDD